MNDSIAMPRVLRGQSVYSKRDHWSDKSIWRFCIGFALIVFSVLFYIGIHVQVMELGYKINSLQKIHDQLVSENKTMSVEVSFLKSPERLEKIAIEQLGLKVPEEKQFVYFNAPSAEEVVTARREP